MRESCHMKNISLPWAESLSSIGERGRNCSGAYQTNVGVMNLVQHYQTLIVSSGDDSNPIRISMAVMYPVLFV